MRYLNKVMLIGNVANDVKFSVTDPGQPRCNFLLITNRVYQNPKGETVQQPEAHNITAWGKWAQFLRDYVKKGKLLFIEGHLHTHELEKEKRSFTEVVVHELIILSPKEAEALV